MKKFALLILIALGLFTLHAIRYIEGSHKQAFDQEMPRSTTAAWHHGNDDQHWYGTNRWAVRYKFNNIFGVTDSVQFTPTSALIYLPTLTDRVDVQLYTEQTNMPSVLLASGYSKEVQGLVNITLTPVSASQSITRSILWLVVTLPTAANGPYIAAENTGGQNSYYWNNSPGTDGYFQSMESLGYASEFLFSLVGDFVFTSQLYEMELQSFDLAGEYHISSTLVPRFTIRNASSNTISNAKLIFQITSAITDIAERDTVDLPVFQPNQTLIVDETNSSLYLDPIQLLRDPCQYHFSVSLESGYADSLDYVSNNLLSGSFDTLNSLLPGTLIENFVRNNSYTNLLINSAENQYGNNRDVIINYYPNASDWLYETDSYQRYLMYRSIGYPEVIFNGIQRIRGFQPFTYSSQFENALDLAHQNTTFIREVRIQPAFVVGNDVIFKLTFYNEGTSMFDPYLERCRLYLGIVETVTDSISIPKNIFRGFVATDDSIAVHLTAGEAFENVFSFRYSEIDTLNLPNTSIGDCSLVYFIQNRDDNRIYWSGLRSLKNLEQTVANGDEIAVVEEPSIYPNPCSLQNPLQIQLPHSRNVTEYVTKIYNIRGQLVYTFPITKTDQSKLTWNQKDDSGTAVSSGIYLIRMEGISNHKTIFQHTKKVVLVN